MTRPHVPPAPPRPPAPQSRGLRRQDGPGERSVASTLARLLQLTSDAVLVFDRYGRVTLANDEALALFGREGTLVGLDVRELLADVEVPEPSGERPEFDVSDLAFPVDGTRAVVTCLRPDGRYVPMLVRCEPVGSPANGYLLVAHHANAREAQAREYERELLDLRRANHRLSGALDIVLATIDSQDVRTLFSRVLDKIAQTMEADGTIVYLAHQDGFHLRGLSKGLSDAHVARFMRYDRTLERLIAQGGGAVRLQVRPPSPSALRAGRLASREVLVEDTQEVLRLRAEQVPPFSSYVFVPVWFDGGIVSVIEVGWHRMRSIQRDDAQLLDSVAHYLSVQLVGAFSELRMQRQEHLAQLASELREELMAAPVEGGTTGMRARLGAVMDRAAEALEARAARVHVNAHQRVVVADLPHMGSRSLPVDVDDLVAGAVDADGVAAVPLALEGELANLLRELGEPCVGAVVDMGWVSGHRMAYLVLRPDGAEPLEQAELDFLRRLAADGRRIGLGEEAREQDKRISQALQAGMRNELQHVDGITAQDVYCSATEDAFVGGDFYDLIRLPDRRACVIMGDVSGKGVEAASVASAVKTALGAYAWEGLAPADMVRTLNEFLMGFSRIETFATLFVGLVDLAAGTITYCSAGHPPALLMGHEGVQMSILDVQSGVVGAFHDMVYQDGVVGIEEGDVLILYTDGTTEARSPSGDFFGEQGLRDMVMRESGEGKDFDGFLERLLATLERFCGGSLNDDVSMVALRFDVVG